MGHFLTYLVHFLAIFFCFQSCFFLAIFWYNIPLALFSLLVIHFFAFFQNVNNNNNNDNNNSNNNNNKNTNENRRKRELIKEEDIFLVQRLIERRPRMSLQEDEAALAHDIMRFYLWLELLPYICHVHKRSMINH